VGVEEITPEKLLGKSLTALRVLAIARGHQKEYVESLDRDGLEQAILGGWKNAD